MAISSAQSPGPSIRYAVLEACVRSFHSDGIVTSYPDVEFGWRPPSNYEYAVDANAAYVCLIEISKGLRDLVKAPAFLQKNTPEAAEALDTINSKRRALSNVGQDIVMTELLFRTFKKELEDLGVDTKSAPRTFALIRSRFDSFAHSQIPKTGEAWEPFGDVPAGHWAAGATKNLRREGILAGYADGKFRG